MGFHERWLIHLQSGGLPGKQLSNPCIACDQIHTQTSQRSQGCFAGECLMYAMQHFAHDYNISSAKSGIFSQGVPTADVTILLRGVIQQFGEYSDIGKSQIGTQSRQRMNHVCGIADQLRSVARQIFGQSACAVEKRRAHHSL